MIVIGVLAHNNPACIADTVASIRRYVEQPAIILFNGGADTSLNALANKLGLEYCRYSRPLYHDGKFNSQFARGQDGRHKLLEFPLGLMRHLRDVNHNYEFLVTIESDMLIIREGLETFLRREMVDSYYMGTNFHFLGDRPGWEIGRYFLHHWSKWKPLLGDVRPAGCFNPGQVFRREFVNRLLDFPLLNEILTLARVSRLPALDEILYATLAVALNASPRCNPGSSSLTMSVYDSRQLHSFIKDQSVFLLHKVCMDVNSPDRAFLRAIRNGAVPTEFDIARPRAGKWSRSIRSVIKGLYYETVVRA